MPYMLQSSQLNKIRINKSQFYYSSYLIECLIYARVYIYKIYICGEGHGNPLQYSCLENLMGRGTWRAHGGHKESDTTYDWTVWVCVCVCLIKIYLFIFGYYLFILATVSELSVVAASRGHSLVAAGGPLTWWFLLLWCMGSRASGLSGCNAWA